MTERRSSSCTWRRRPRKWRRSTPQRWRIARERCCSSGRSDRCPRPGRRPSSGGAIPRTEIDRPKGNYRHDHFRHQGDRLRRQRRQLLHYHDREMTFIRDHFGTQCSVNFSLIRPFPERTRRPRRRGCGRRRCDGDGLVRPGIFTLFGSTVTVAPAACARFSAASQSAVRSAMCVMFPSTGADFPPAKISTQLSLPASSMMPRPSPSPRRAVPSAPARPCRSAPLRRNPSPGSRRDETRLHRPFPFSPA